MPINRVRSNLEGRFDVGFLHPTVDLIEGGDRLIVERCKFIAAIPEKWDLARQEEVSLAELGQLPMIMAPLSESPKRLNDQLSAFRDVGVSPRIAQEATQTTTVLSLVAAEVGAAFCMETAALTGYKGVAFRLIHDLPPHIRWERAMVWHPQHTSEAAQLFIDYVKDHCSSNPRLMLAG